MENTKENQRKKKYKIRLFFLGGHDLTVYEDDAFLEAIHKGFREGKNAVFSSPNGGLCIAFSHITHWDYVLQPGHQNESE